MKIAVIADLHLPHIKNTPQWDFWDWAKQNILRNKPEVLVVLGDISANGNISVIEQFLQDIQNLPGEKLVIRGNSDLRTDINKAKSLLSNYEQRTIHGWNLIAMDEGDGRLIKSDFSDCKNRILLFSHHDFTEDINFSDNLYLYVYGHVHKDSYQVKNKTSIYSINGCDPDKAIGREPKISYFEVSEDNITVTNEVWTEAGFSNWTEIEKKEFLHLLGISCYQAREGIEFATKKGISCIELRPNAVLEPRKDLVEKIQNWRISGGKYLSVHMPDIGLDEKGLLGAEDWINSIMLAKDMKADGLTVHVPKISVKTMRNGGREIIGTFIAKMLLELPSSIQIGIENMHMVDGEVTDENRRYGYLPMECIEWAQYLTEIGKREIKLHLDVGHARNNRPFSEMYTLGVWYALLGTNINAYHIHQTSNDNNIFHNHQPIRGLHEELISYGSFLQSWRTKRISHRPMFVEVKNLEDAYHSIEVFKKCAYK